MKHIHIPLMLAATLLAGCNSMSSDKEAIREAAYGYIVATGNYQLDEAAPYASKVTREVTLPLIKEKLMPLVDSTFLANSVPATATVDTIVIAGDTAYVGYTKTTPLGVSQNTLTMVKEDGKWLAYVPLNMDLSAKPQPETESTTLAAQ